MMNMIPIDIIVKSEKFKQIFLDKKTFQDLKWNYIYLKFSIKINNLLKDQYFKKYQL